MASKSKIVEDLGLEPKQYLVFTMHKAENTEIDTSFVSIIRAFTNLSDVKIVFPIHPRTKKILQAKKLKLSKTVEIFYLNLLQYVIGFEVSFLKRCMYVFFASI
ncbi:hypothetical protein BH23THE1_BH23THE1_19640 [soil metagenome]